MRLLLKSAVIITAWVAGAGVVWGQGCGKTVVNPSTHRLDCVGANGQGSPNIKASSVGSVTSLTLATTSLNVADTTTLEVQCWTGTTTFAPVTITSLNPVTIAGGVVTVVTPNFAATGNVYCTASSNGGAGPTGASGGTGATGATGAKGDTGATGAAGVPTGLGANDTNIQLSLVGGILTPAWASTLSTARGGLGGNFSACTGLAVFSAGTVTCSNNPVLNTLVGQPSTAVSALIGRVTLSGTEYGIEVQNKATNAHIAGIDGRGIFDGKLNILGLTQCVHVDSLGNPTGTGSDCGAGGGGISSLNTLTGSSQTFVNDTNVTIVSSGTTHTLTWAGTLAKARIISSAVYNDQSNTWTTGTQDFSTAAHFTPKHGSAASKPGTCTLGEVYSADDATPGQNWYFCTASNTWTQQLNSGGVGGTGNAPAAATVTVDNTGHTISIACPSATGGTLVYATASPTASTAYTINSPSSCTPYSHLLISVTQPASGGVTVTSPTGYDAVTLDQNGGTSTIWIWALNASGAAGKITGGPYLSETGVMVRPEVAAPTSADKNNVTGQDICWPDSTDHVLHCYGNGSSTVSATEVQPSSGTPAQFLTNVDTTGAQHTRAVLNTDLPGGGAMTINGTGCALNGSCAPYGGAVVYTTSHTIGTNDIGKLVVMNCSAPPCVVTFKPTPASSDFWGIESTGSTLATIILNGLNWNNQASPPAINNSYRVLNVTTDGSNYFGDAPLVQGSGITMTPTATQTTISATGASGSGVQSAVVFPSYQAPIVPLGLSLTAPVTVANTLAATTILGGTYLGSATLPPGNYVGKTYRVRASGQYGSTATPTLTVTISLGGVTIATLTPTILSATTNDGWTLDFAFTVASMTSVNGSGCFQGIGTSGAIIGGCAAATTTGLDFGTAQAIDVKATWSAAAAGNTITAYAATVVPTA